MVPNTVPLVKTTVGVLRFRRLDGIRLLSLIGPKRHRQAQVLYEVAWFSDAPLEVKLRGNKRAALRVPG